MKEYIQAHIQRYGSGYRAECFDLPIVAEGNSLDETVENLHAEIQKFLAGQNLADIGFIPEPKVMVSFNFGPCTFADA